MRKVLLVLLTYFFISIPMFYFSALFFNMLFTGNIANTGPPGSILITIKDCFLIYKNNPIVIPLWFIYTGLITLCVWLKFNSNSYTTKEYKVTDKISIPMPSGENQYGSSWFISQSEFNKKYPYNVVNTKKDNTIRYLIDTGYDDLPFKLQPHKLRSYIYNKVALSEFALKLSTKSPKKIRKALNLEPFKENGGGLVVGYRKRGKKEYWNTVTDDVHALILGYTGSGKSRNFVLQSIINIALAGESMFINDIKGELFQYTAPLLRKLGYQVNVLDFKNMGKSMSYNLLQPIINSLNNKNLNLAIQQSKDVANILVGEKTKNGEPLWHNGELAVISASILACCYDNINKPHNQNLPYVYHFITKMCEQRKGQPLLLQEYLEAVGEGHPANLLLAQANVAPEKTKGSFYTSAATTLQLWTDKQLYHMVNKSDFDLAGLGKRKTAFYMILPDDRTTFYSVATLIVAQMYERLSEYADVELGGGRLPVRVNFMLDEFGNFPAIPDFNKKLTLSRSKGIRFYLFLQSIAQLESEYDKVIAQIILDNCPLWIYLTVSNPETLKLVAEKLDKYTTTSYSRSSSKSTDTNTSVNYIGRDLLTPGELQRLQRPYILVMHEGDNKVSQNPDISKWSCNKMLGLGNKRHNTKLREFRENNRPILNDVSKPTDYEGLWIDANFKRFCQAYKLRSMLRNKEN